MQRGGLDGSDCAQLCTTFWNGNVHGRKDGWMDVWMDGWKGKI